MIEEFASNWEEIFKSNNKKSLNNFIENTSYKRIEENDDIILYSEFNKIINELKNNKSPGPNGITNEMIIVLGKQEKFLIFKALKLVWKHKCIPSTWNLANITLINKGNCIMDVLDYRPITLQNVDMKIFTKIIKNKIERLNEKYEMNDPLQFGFQGKIGTAQLS
jgi:hypothetical protein